MIVITRSGKLDEWLKFRQQIIIGVELLNGHDHKMLSKSVYDSIWLSSRHFFFVYACAYKCGTKQQTD